MNAELIAVMQQAGIVLNGLGLIFFSLAWLVAAAIYVDLRKK